MPDERVLGIPDDRPTADAHGERHPAPSVRRAAEALFKTTERVAPPAEQPPTIAAPPAADEPSRRKPRILTVAPAVPARAEVETPAAPPSQRQTGAVEEGPSKIPPSQHGRVVALVKYGMTRQQVAEFYEAPLSEVTRIVRS